MIVQTKKQTDILNILIEEAAEVIQATSKVQRFGLTSEHPTTKVSNQNHLEEEIGDLLMMIELAIDAFGLCQNEIDSHKLNKKHKLSTWVESFK